MTSSYIPQLACSVCHAPAGLLDWQCTQCGSPLDITNLPPFDASAIAHEDWSVWRYAASLPAPRRFSLGEGGTPLVTVNLSDGAFRAKLEFLNPTGSFKDRGTVTLINHLLSQGVRNVVGDSSGNAGASLAAYSIASGIRARIFVAINAAPGKKRQIALGAELVEIEGSRAAVTDACVEAARESTYATHAWSPFFTAGQMTGAWEIWEQMGRRAPDAVACPLGQGGLFLGYTRGFKALYDAGLIDRVPRMYAVQSANCDPVVRAYEAGMTEVAAITPQPTIADGMVIANPVRGRQILAALRETDGAAFRLDDDAIRAARDLLTRHGLLVEPTSAAPVAALPAIRRHLGAPDAEIVVALTGSGLKSLSA